MESRTNNMGEIPNFYPRSSRRLLGVHRTLALSNSCKVKGILGTGNGKKSRLEF